MSATDRIVVIGGGINGMVAAAELARAGRHVTIVESNARLGGFIDSGERTLPGYVHDTFSSWHPLFVSGPAYAELGAELHRHGLEYANTEGALTATAFTRRGEHRAVIAYRDAERTAAALPSEADAAAYLAMLGELGPRGPVVFGALGADLGRRRALAALGWKAWRSLGASGISELAKDALASGRSFAARRFAGPEVDALWVPWLLHAGLGPDHASGGVMLPVFAGTMHQAGLPIVVGGAARFVDAFTSLLTDLGVDIRTGHTAREIVVESGRVRAVRTSEGTIAADRVVAGVAPRALYETLLKGVASARAGRDKAAGYLPGRGAMQIHLALDRPVPWRDARLSEVPLVHLAEGSDSTGVAVAQASAGVIPQRPTVVVGQQSVLDPGRAPAGGATLWLQLQEVPTHPVADAAERLPASRGWTDAALREGFLDRVLGRLEEYAPGVTASVLGRDIISPADLEAYNANAIDGDPYSGAATLDQNLLWRPFAGGAGHRTGVRGVWHIGAATHPGPGLGAGSGHLVAQRLLASRR
ncbi:NAD(P)/FAD-dependent oxidoreductase [Microbacterium sp. SORGH_AS_0888]|uniref:phytoene desaturase family protein n=1 Tax=Microbacterium sp. SORGH_AS_0888 TaxID=3041791 RepID=UPI002789EA3B|nr:NAD(P)/FAD-dependent oxidoreductase [Microbacterium sp. SORGH_AS_0888]MDQ1128729.1 phytoene dehydrogenase-like protein [Microbacterium sp. SORGH_AS_0888]